MKFLNRIVGLTLILLCFASQAESVGAGNASLTNEAEIWSYTIRSNDSFERIYQKYLSKHSDVEALSKYNNHALKKKLQPGQVINIPVEMLKKIPTSAQVLLAYGDVNASEGSAEPHKVKKGDLLPQGTLLTTGKNSLAKLLFADGSNIDIQPNSNLSIQESYQYAGKETFVTNLKLVKGRTQVSANPTHVIGNTLQVQTPSAVAAVRGTQFRVGADDNIALQETLEGQVAFTARGQEVLLAKGYGSVAEKDKAPLPPIQLPDAPDVSALSKLFETQFAEFNLAPQTAVVAWVGQLAADAEFTQILNEQTTTSGKMLFADLADGQYFLKLRAQDQHGLQGVDATHAFNIKFVAPEPVVELIEPLDGAVIGLAPTYFSWDILPSSTAYLVQIARDEKFTDVVFERQASFNKLTINHSFGTGEFYWRVAAISGGKSHKFSKIRKFSR